MKKCSTSQKENEHKAKKKKQLKNILKTPHSIEKIPCTKRHIHKRTTHKYTFTCPDTKIHLLINCHTLNQNPERKKIVFFSITH